jgi:hypothetical protein
MCAWSSPPGLIQTDRVPTDWPQCGWLQCGWPQCDWVRGCWIPTYVLRGNEKRELYAVCCHSIALDIGAAGYNRLVSESPANRYSASSRNLRSLLIIRSLVILCQLMLLWYLRDKPLANTSAIGMIVTTVSLALVTLLSFARLRRSWPVTDQEYFAQLCVDVAALSIFLFFSGGGNIELRNRETGDCQARLQLPVESV